MTHLAQPTPPDGRQLDTSISLSGAGYRVPYAGPRPWLLRGVDLELRPGSVTVLVGPNGAGKSTLLRLVAGLLAPAEGTRCLISATGSRSPLPEDLRERGRWVHFVAAEHHPVFDFRVEQVVAMGRYPHRGRSGHLDAEDREQVHSAMERTDLLHLAERSVLSLSSGELRRVWIARALVTQARFILLDEPTANLDPGHALDVFDLVRAMAEAGHGLVVAVHDLQAAYTLADAVVLLDQGRVHAQGPAVEVLRDDALAAVFGVRFERFAEATSPLDSIQAVRVGSEADPRDRETTS